MAARRSIRRSSSGIGGSRSFAKPSISRERGGSRGITESTTPLLDQISAALKPDWHGTRAAGHIERQVEILRDVAHALSPSADRPDRPRDAHEAEARLNAVLADLQAKTPRMGLAASDGHFVDHLVSLSGRYGSHLFVCFDDPRVPPTTNELEGFFGEFKRFERTATGRGSTANGLAQSLGGELLLVFHEARHRGPPREAHPVDVNAFRRTRAAIADDEAPARRRRSLVRNLEDNLARLVECWGAARARAKAEGQPSRLAASGEL